MITVAGVVDRVGPTLLRAVPAASTPYAQARPVTDVVIAETSRRNPVAEGDLVLGVAANTPGRAAKLVGYAGTRGAAAVLLKPPLASCSAVLAAAGSGGIAVVEVHAAAAWAQLVWLLRTVLDAAADERAEENADRTDQSDPTAGEPGIGGLGDLFRLADVAASVVDAPVTIEDANSRVLAYSARQDRTDPARISTIMGRRVPDDVLARFRSRGVFRELTRGRPTIFVPAQRDGTLPRLIVPIRMGGELLGSMWAVVSGPVSHERTAAFADTAPVVALHLLRRRARADAQRRRLAEVVRAVLRGKASMRLAAAELDLDDERHRIVAIDVDTDDAVGAEGMRLALWERLTAGIGRRPAVAELDDVLYAIVPDHSGPDGWPALRAALNAPDAGVRPTRDRAGSTVRGGPLVAAGPPVALAELPGSLVNADEVLGLLRAGLIAGQVATFDEAWPVLALHRMAAAAGDTGIAKLGPLARVIAADERTGTSYMDTLYEWLRHPGDPRSASAALRIHPNTLRYRMRRLAELVEVDLRDPDVRMALLVQLVAVRWG